MSEAPRRISKREMSFNIQGYFLPALLSNVPMLLGMPGTEDLFIAVFSTKEKLDALMQGFGIEYGRVSVVTDQYELLDDIEAVNQSEQRPYRIRLAIDAYKTEDGRVRFTEPLPRKN